jgi:streptogramin lyase
MSEGSRCDDILPARFPKQRRNCTVDRAFRRRKALSQEGNIWFTGNFAGYIGKLDPKTGAIIEYRLPDEARDPHTPVFDQAGSLWFTVQGADMIGRLVPKTGRHKARARADA